MIIYNKKSAIKKAQQGVPRLINPKRAYQAREQEDSNKKMRELDAVLSRKDPIYKQLQADYIKTQMEASQGKEYQKRHEDAAAKLESYLVKHKERFGNNIPVTYGVGYKETINPNGDVHYRYIDENKPGNRYAPDGTYLGNLNDIKYGTVQYPIVPKSLQEELKNKGLYAGKIDGLYGPNTDLALDRFIKDDPETGYELVKTYGIHKDLNDILRAYRHKYDRYEAETIDKPELRDAGLIKFTERLFPELLQNQEEYGPSLEQQVQSAIRDKQNFETTLKKARKK